MHIFGSNLAKLTAQVFMAILNAFRLDVSRLMARGLKPGPWCSKLKAGESVEAPNGESVSFGTILDKLTIRCC